MAPGRHRITLVNGRYNYRDTVELSVRAGEITNYTIEPSMGVLIVNTSPGAEVFVDGERIGSAPLAPIPAAVGPRDVVVRHVKFGERRQSVDVTAGRPVELSVLFESTIIAPRQQPRLAPLSMPPPRRR